LYFLAAGEVPFVSERAFDSINKINNQKHPDVRSLNPEISHTLARAIDRLLEKDPEHRFGSAAELEKFFEELVSHMNQPTKHKLPVVPKGSGHRRNVVASIAISACAILLLAIGSVWAIDNFWPVPANTSEARSLQWKEIQQRYDIGSPDEINLDLVEFSEDFREFESSFNRVDEIGLENDSFVEQAKRIERELLERSRSIGQ
jgi:serine/threonine protein kinase